MVLQQVSFNTSQGYKNDYFHDPLILIVWSIKCRKMLKNDFLNHKVTSRPAKRSWNKEMFGIFDKLLTVTLTMRRLASPPASA